MIRKFLRNTSGNYMILTAAAIVPIMGALALAVDYTEMTRQRQETLNALDAAGIATARYIAQGATDAEAKAYAKDFFEANLSSVSPSNATLSVLLPTENTGGGTLKLSAGMKYQPYFFPTFAALIGETTAETGLDFNATSEVRLKNTLEVALVLDNSGSMDYIGSGSGKKRMVLLKDAAKQLVDTIAAEGEQMKQLAKPVQFGVVPFAASVNVGPSNKTAAWMDTDGLSPIHHENFSWGTMATYNSNKKVEASGGIYYKKGSGWGAEENQKVTRFTMYDDIKRITGYTSVKTGSGWECVKPNWWSNSCNWVWKDYYEDQPVYDTFAAWQGCVEARPYPYNVNDAAASTSTPATLFVPMFAPDETDKKDGYNRSAMGNWWNDLTGSSDNATRQKYMPKYFAAAGNGTPASGSGAGPNASCTTTAITPLTDVTVEAGKTSVKNAIDAMASNGATNVPEGMAWGWRVVSSGAPFTEGRPETERGNDKVVIVLTDGANTYYTPDSLGYNDLAGNKSIYSNYGYTSVGYNGGSTRLFQNTSSSVSKSDYSNGNYTKALNEQFTTLCANAKAAGLIVMTVSLDLSSSDNTEKEQIAALKSCASDSKFRKDASDSSKPAKLYWNATGSSLSNDFKEIADELSNLRIVG
jgi:Flp pilus assembly protein TadG